MTPCAPVHQLPRQLPRRAPRLGAALLALSLALHLGGAARAETIYVGNDASCDEASVGLALARAASNGEPADEIRLPRDLLYLNFALHLTDWAPAGKGSLVISGGYDNCSDTTRSGETILYGNGTDPVVEVDTLAQPVSMVTLRNLELRDGVPGLLAEGGATVYVEHSRVRLNEGGIKVTAGADVEINHFSEVRENSGADLGGGIACFGSGSTVTLYGRVAFNTATSAGGGIYAISGCLVKLGWDVWIEGNQANLGGGLFLGGTARAENLGTGIANLNIYQNVAFYDGGGIYMAGTGPQTLLGNVRIVSNQAGERGGGVALVGGARLQLERFNFEECTTPPRCVKINENLVTTGGVGSAVYADGGSEFRMFQGYVESNNDSEFAGFALYATGTGTTMLFEGIQIAHNSTESLFRAEDGAEITAAFVSAAGNDYVVDGGPTILDSHGGQAYGGATIAINTSILVDQRPFVTGTGGEIRADCVLLETTDGLTHHWGSMVGFDPHFVDVDAGDLHVQRSSPALDSCDTAVYTPLDSDADLDARGYDFTSEPDILGPYDRGFDELRPLFADGFGSGNTTAWSATAP